MIKKHIVIDSDCCKNLEKFIELNQKNQVVDIDLLTTVANENETAFNTSKIYVDQDFLVANGAEKAISDERKLEYDNEKIPSAVQAMETIIKQSKDMIEILTFGPLTNIATFILCNPKLKNKIEKIHVVGGVYVEGDRTPATENTIAFDPEAAKIVFLSGIKIDLYGLDSSIIKKSLTDIEKQGIEIDESTFYGEYMYYQFADRIEPLKRQCYVDVDLQGEHTRGSLVVDYPNTLRKDFNVQLFEGILKNSQN